MFSRYFVIVLAVVAAGFRARDHAWAETAGLSALAVGLILLRVADLRRQPLLKRVAWACFAITLIAMGIVFQRDYLH